MTNGYVISFGRIFAVSLKQKKEATESTENIENVSVSY